MAFFSKKEFWGLSSFSKGQGRDFRYFVYKVIQMAHEQLGRVSLKI